MRFKIVSKFIPTGDQPEAISRLSQWLKAGERHQTLLGVTGSGKTFTMAKIVEALQRPTLVISPNKTLAAQLYSEFRQFFPNSAVHYFVSYYDYYQPEAYIPQTDTYIAKEAMVNDEIDRLRHAATQSLLTRPDVLIVASVSCIYGLGSPLNYQAQKLSLKQGQVISRQKFLKEIVARQYGRNDLDFGRGTFRARGDIVEIHPVTGEDIIRLEWGGDVIETITLVPNIVRKKFGQGTRQILEYIDIYPAKHFVAPLDKEEQARKAVRAELKERTAVLRAEGKDLEAQRLEQRTNYDLELIETAGYCNGIENYSRHFDHRHPGEPPFTLLDYFSHTVTEQKLGGYLTFLDESHITIPQLRGMYAGDYSRKQMLVDYGWRLPSAFDNRPLNFQEFSDKTRQLLYVSATPNDYELKLSGAMRGFNNLRKLEVSSSRPEAATLRVAQPHFAGLRVAQQLIRPTGILDPEVIVRPTDGQLDDLMKEIKARVEKGEPYFAPSCGATKGEPYFAPRCGATKGERTLVTTLTKRLAEELTDYLAEAGIKVQYLHSDVETLERVEILKNLRAGLYDVVVGINLLREGLDLPEVSLVAILDADKEGFLRNETTLIQTMGRAARHIEGKVIMYADNMTLSMKRAIVEVERRRAIQEAYNKKHGIRPRPIERAKEADIVDEALP